MSFTNIDALRAHLLASQHLNTVAETTAAVTLLLGALDAANKEVSALKDRVAKLEKPPIKPSGSFQ